jgi:Uncharacterised nucleotidyltransferase
VAVRPGEVLKACLLEDAETRRRRLAGLVAGVDRERLLDAARYHRVIGYAYRALREIDGVDPGLIAALAALDRQGLQAHLRVLGALKRAGEPLDRLAIPWLVVKGPALTETAYKRAGLRLYYDLDLVVPRESFASVLEALEGEGFFLIDRNWDLIRRHMIGELVLSRQEGPEIDVHWDFLYDRKLRREVRMPFDELNARGRPISIGGVAARTLDSTDTLISIALHACKQGGDRLIWLKDVERTVANDPPEWAAVVERSLAWRVNLFVGGMLLRSQRVLGAAVPDDVVRELLPSRAWRATLAGLDRLFPPERSAGFGTPATLVVRSTRGDLPSTLATSAEGLLNRAKRLLRGGALRRDAAQDDPDDPASRAFPTGAPGSRERYLEEVMLEP